MSCRKDTTNNDTILSRLQNAEFRGVGLEIKEFLKPLLQNDSSYVANKNTKRSVHLALRYLHAYCARFDEIPEEDLTAAVDAIEDCVCVSRLPVQITAEPLYVTKLLTNCVSKAARLGCMKIASRLASCLLKDLSQFDIPLSSDCAELAHFAATYLWYGCCDGGSPASQDGIGSDLSQKDCVLFNSCCQYLELLLLGQKEAASVPKQLATILKSFRKPPTSARWKVVIAGVQKVLQLIVSCSEVNAGGETDLRLSLACCHAESVAVFVSFLVSFQKSEAAESTICNLVSSLESTVLSDVIGKSDFDGLKLVGGILLTFVKSTGGTKLSKEPSTFGVEIVEKCMSLLDSSLQQFKSNFAKIQPVTARMVVMCVESLLTLLLANKDGHVLSDESLQTAVALYSCQLELCEAVLRCSRTTTENERVCQILCLKRDVWFRKLQLINTHLQKNGNGIAERVVNECLKEICLFDKFLDESISAKALSADDYISLGNLTFRLGYFFYLASQRENAVALLSVTVSQHQRFIVTESGKTDPARARRKFQISKVYELLVDSLRKLDRLDEALDATVNGFIADDQRLSWTYGAWARIMSRLVACENSWCQEMKTLTTRVQERLSIASGSSDCKIDEVTSLQEEHKAADRTRCANSIYHLQVLNELIAASHSDVCIMTAAMLDKAHLLYRTNSGDSNPQSSLDLCSQVTKLLKGTSDCVGTDILARANLSTYLLRGPDRMDKLLESSIVAVTKIGKKSETTRAFSGDDTIDEDDSELFTVCSQIAAEEELLAPVHEALSLWELCFPADNAPKKGVVIWERTVDWTVSIDYVEVLVMIYKLMESPQLARAVRLLSNVARSASDDRRRLVADIETASLYNWLHQPQMAAVCVTATEAWLSQSDVAQTCCQQYAEFLITKAETLLLNKKVSESMEVLREVSSLCHSSSKLASKERLLIESMTWLIEAKVKIVMLVQSATCPETDSLPAIRDSPDTPLELAVASIRHIVGVIQYALDPAHNEYCVVEKWHLLELFSRAAFYAGLCYVQAGEVRGAKSMLLHCLVFCEAFRLRKRFCEVHLALAELCIVCHQHNDCYVHVRLVTAVLNPKKHRRIVLPAKLKSDIPASSTYRMPDCSDTSDGEEEGTDFLRSCMTSLDYQTVSDPCGSPTTSERFTVTLPPTWKHRHNCGCLLCSDIATERIWLRSHIIEAANRLHQDNVSDSKTMLSAAIKQRDRLSANVSAQASLFGSAVCDDHARGKAHQLFAATAVYQTDFDVIALTLCEAAFLGKDLKHFSSCYSQAEEALWSNYLPSDRSHVYLAELFYIGATPRLLWPSTAQLVPKSKLSSIDILCAGIGRVSITEIATPPNPPGKSRKAERVASFVACDNGEQTAESQKNRGRNDSSVVAAPVKSRPIAAKVSGRSRKSAKETAPDAGAVTSLQTRKKHDKACVVKRPSACDDSSTTVEACLQRALSVLWLNPSVPLYRDVCGALAVHLYNSRSTEGVWNVAFYLSEGHAPTLRHSSCLNAVRKMRKVDSGDYKPEDYRVMQSDGYRQRLVDMRQRLGFGCGVDTFKDMISGLPADLVVCQLSVVKPVGQSVGRLYLTRFQSGFEPLIICLPGYETAEGQKLLGEFEAVMQENHNSMKITEKRQWWSRRRALDTLLEDLLKELENQLVGCWKGAMCGLLLHKDDCLQLDRATAKVVAKFDKLKFNEPLLRCVLNGLSSMTDHDVVNALPHCVHDGDSVSKSTWEQLFKTVKLIGKSMNIAAASCGPVTLVLDRVIQHLPWESMPVLIDHRVTRMPSVQFLFAHWRSLIDDPASVVNVGVNRRSVFYVVNPDNDLMNTQKTFESWFSSEQGWQGIIGRKPTSEEITSGISSCDLFVYSGHGNGSAYVAEDTLQQVPCRSAAILMGCSSGRLVAHGNLDASGTMLHYLLAGAACVVGNLWDVTDREIDRFLESTLRQWFSDGTCKLVEAARAGRLACKLRFLTGAAPVIYGIPVSLAPASL